MPWQGVLDFVLELRRKEPKASKQAVANAVAKKFDLAKRRSVYAGRAYALRFSSASGKSFSNVVLSLSALQAYDGRPFVVVILRPGTTEFLLANTTFLKKISHSSHKLRADNIRGSFLGHDIVREYDGIPNTPEHFGELFARHSAFTWQENLERLVETTKGIVGTGRKFMPSEEETGRILRAPLLAASVLEDPKYQQMKHELSDLVVARASRILEHAAIDNVNVCGNRIEQEITGGINEHNLADLVWNVGDNIAVQLEIKSKLLDRASSPKAYNIDKALQELSDGSTLIAFVFVGVDLPNRLVTASTVSIFDEIVLEATRIQFHWAGRNSRGVTQLTGNLTPLFQASYHEEINVERARNFLKGLIDL